MAGVVDGQAVSALVSNAAFLAKNGDDTATGVIALANVATGATVPNVQAAINANAAAITAEATARASGDTATASAAATALAAHEADTTNIHGIADTATLSIKTAVETLSNKTFADALTFTQIATPAIPGAGLRKVYAKTDGKLYHLGSDGVETAVGSGSGGGSGVLNLLTLDTTFAATKSTNADAETTVGDWVAFADAASTQPVDMTGGSPNTTITRSTSTPLNGTGHFLMTLTAGASRQGEGVSCVANIPPAYRGKTLAFTFPFQATGTLVEDDFKLFAYDVTNSELITPYTFGKILGASGTAGATFTTKTNTAQIRVGIFVARVSTAAATISFDDVKVSPEIPAMGLAGSNSTDISSLVSFTNLGNVTNLSAFMQRVGDTVRIYGFATGGTATGSAAQFNLPPNLPIDYTKVPSSSSRRSHRGTYFRGSEGSSNDIFTTGRGGVMFSDGVITNALFMARSTDTVGFAKNAGNATGLGDNSQFSFDFTYPVSGWDANITMGSANQFKISSYLANGTRVTTTPTKLGEYRTYKKTASSTAGTDEAPTTAPSSANGMRIFGVGYAAAGNSGQTNRWDIFVGKGKNVQPLYYGSTGFTTAINTKYFQASSSANVGVLEGYDPVTGILTIDAQIAFSGSETNHYIGYTLPGAGGGATAVTDAYFDVLVSEDARAVGIESNPVASFKVDGAGQAFNSSNPIQFNTKLVDTHSAVTTGSSWKFTAPQSGSYELSFSVFTTNGGNGADMNVRKNGSQVFRTGPNYRGTAGQYLYTTTVIIPMNPGDYIDVIPASTVAYNVYTATTDSYIGIKRVGNQ